MIINDKKIKRLVASGCSFTYVHGLDNPVREAWPRVLGNTLGIECVNLGIKAMGNEHIQNSIIDYFSLNPDHKEDSVVVLGFTLIQRVEFSNATSLQGENTNWPKTWTTLISQRTHTERDFIENFFTKLYDETYYYARFLRIVLLLQNYFKANNIPYIMFNALPVEPKELVNNRIVGFLKQQIDFKYYMDFSQWFFGHFVTSNAKTQIPNDKHPSKFGHEKMADVLANFMKQHYHLLGDNACPYPNGHLSIGQKGELRACCIAKPFDKKVWEVDNLSKWWLESEEYKKLRQDFKEDKKNPTCYQCWSQESKQVKSLRQKVALEKHNSVNPEIYNFEFTGGRLCNLACRMCDGNNSSLIHKEQRPWDQSRNIDLPLNWLDSEKEQKKVLEIIADEKVKKIYFTGGEPQIMPSYQTVLRKLIDMRDLSDVQVHFNTNCTVYNSDFWDCIKKFGTRRIDLSIDGTGQGYDTIRLNGSWEKTRNILFKTRDSLFDIEDRGYQTYFNIVLVAQLANVDQGVEMQYLFNELSSKKRFNFEHKFSTIPVTGYEEWKWHNMPLEILNNEYKKIRNLNDGTVIETFKNQIKSAIENNCFTKLMAQQVLEKEVYFKNQFGFCLWDRKPDWFETYTKLAVD